MNIDGVASIQKVNSLVHQRTNEKLFQSSDGRQNSVYCFDCEIVEHLFAELTLLTTMELMCGL